MYQTTGSQEKSEYNRIRHAAFLLHAHIEFVTKYPRKVFGELHLNSARLFVSEVCGDFGAELKECDGDADHLLSHKHI
ncbi:transposase, partial [Escherichia coli]|uniref:transposase n=1 Tax=Escherichia coli TaxID=562 RepID=UPI00259CBEEC